MSEIFLRAIPGVLVALFLPILNTNVERKAVLAVVLTISLYILSSTWFYLSTCRSFAWTSSPRLPTWSSTRPWRTPWCLASNQPVCRPLRWLWVSISRYTFLQPVTHCICIFIFFVFTSNFPFRAGKSELSGVSGQDLGVSGQVVCPGWDPALPAADPLQRTSRAHGCSR